MTEPTKEFESQLDEGNELEIMFPDHTVTLLSGEKVKIKPISMLHTSKIIRSLRRLLQKFRELQERGFEMEDILQEMLTDCMDELLYISPLCVSIEETGETGDAVLMKIGPSEVPKILNVIIRQNFHPDVLGNWAALATGLSDLIPREALQGMMQQPTEDAK